MAVIIILPATQNDFKIFILLLKMVDNSSCPIRWDKFVVACKPADMIKVEDVILSKISSFSPCTPATQFSSTIESFKTKLDSHMENLGRV